MSLCGAAGQVLTLGSRYQGTEVMDAGHLAAAQVPPEDAQDQALPMLLTDFP